MAAVAKRYAKALYDVAKERDQLEQVGKELQEVLQLIQGEPQLARFLYHPVIPKREKKAFLKEALAQGISEPLYRLMELMLEKDRLTVLADVARYYNEEVNRQRGVLDAEITTATNLDEAKREELKGLLAQMTDKKINLHYRVNPDLLGGITIKIGDLIIDGSIRGKLSRFERMLTTTKS